MPQRSQTVETVYVHRCKTNCRVRILIGDVPAVVICCQFPAEEKNDVFISGLKPRTNNILMNYTVKFEFSDSTLRTRQTTYKKHDFYSCIDESRAIRKTRKYLVFLRLIT